MKPLRFESQANTENLFLTSYNRWLVMAALRLLRALEHDLVAVINCRPEEGRMRSLGLYFLAVAVGFGQHPSAPQSEKPVALLSGLGTWHHQIATQSAAAQHFFDQGLALLYGFNRYEALRSFRKAAELDPDAPMPWWGIAMAQGPHINMDSDGDVDIKQSCNAAEAALKLPNAVAKERAWIEAIAKHCPRDRPDEYIDAMRALAGRYPDDPDVLTFYAESLMVPVRWRWYDTRGRPAEGVTEAEKLLQAVLRRYPDHPGANHFYIHAVESSPTPERAIPSAQRLMGIVPSAGHLVHMPGHIWLVLGDYEMAAAVNLRAVDLDRQYMNDSGVTGSAYFGYYVHNLHFVAIARSMQGRMRESIQAADQMAGALKPILDAMPEMADFFGVTPLLMRVRFQRWDDVLATPPPRPQLATTTALWHYARSVALAAKSQHEDAIREQVAFESARAKVPAASQWNNNKASDLLALAAQVLAGRLAGSPAASVPHWQRAVELQDALLYDEPPAWYYPVRESLGAALLRAGQLTDAETVFREGLRRSPRNGRMLFGLLESLKAQRKTEASEWVTREFEASWRGAEVPVRIEEL